MTASRQSHAATEASALRFRRAGRAALAFLLAIVAATAQASAAAADAETLAREILSSAGVEGGLVVHLGCGDGRLTAALRANDRYLVHGLDADAANVEKARRHIRSKGLYGPVSVDRLTGTRLPYADNLVDLVVAEDLGDVPMADVVRVLAPLGVALVGGKKTVKPWPGAIDEWTHYLHGPDNNATARDRRVGPPRRLQWKSDPLYCRSHNGTPSSVGLVVSAKGRLFSMIDEGLTGQPGLPERWTIVARGAFNGTLLWKKHLQQRVSPKALAAVGDRVYLTVGRGEPVMALDAATGETVRTYDGTKGSDELVCIDGALVVHLRGVRKPAEGGPDGIVAVDADTGRPRWDAPAKGLVPHSLAAADGRVCYHDRQAIVCLGLADGKERWRAPLRAPLRGGTLMMYGGVVFFDQGGLQAFDGETGKHLWEGPSINRRLSFFGAGGLVWVSQIQERGRTFLWTPGAVEARGYDPKTGEVKRTVTVSHLITPGHHIRCYPAKATERYLLLPKRGVEFVDLEGTNHMRHDWLRGPCGHGVIAGNGLLYAPPHQCFCYPGVKVTGYNAVSADPVEPAGPRPAEARLERGPAYGAGIADLKSQISDPKSQISDGRSQISDADWPAYRHDVLRSGRAGCDLPVELPRLWQRDVGGATSQPVVADGRLLVAEKDAHTVHCLAADTGNPLWTFTAGARIDSPPTLHEGLVLFGSADGWVYCLRASDGELVWRFQAAPEERRIGAFDQLESAWPVHGSVLVQDGIAYATAGRSSFLDGGIWIYALDPKTGKTLHERHLESERPDVTREAGRPFDMDGARSDVLVSDGRDLYMFFHRFGPDLASKPTPRTTKLGDRDVSLHLMSNAGLLDTSWFDRNYWTYSRRWPGYYFAYNGPKAGQILAFDDETTYGLHVFTSRQGHSPRFWPGTDGYELFADRNDAEPVLRPMAIGREKGDGYSRTLQPKWSVQVPVRFQAMLVAGAHLYAAGPPDVVPSDDPYAAFEGRKGARLWVVSTEDGRRLAEYPLDRPPVFDGLSAARGRLYLATDDGRVICMGAK